MALPNPASAIDRVRREIERSALRARNGIGLAAGVAGPRTGQTAKDVVWRHGRSELWHYRNDNVRFSPPLVIVFSLISKSYVLDLNPGNSFVERLLAEGFDVYMFDWGEPDERDAHNRLDDYADVLIPAGIDRVLELSGATEVNLLGYCFGGVLTLLYAAHHTDAPLRSLTVMATPVDFREMGPIADIFGRTGLELDTVLDENGNVPASVILQSFRILAPVAQVSQYVNLWEKLWNDEYVAAYSAMTGWGSDHIPFPGAAARQTVEMLVRGNGFLHDRLELGGDRVSLKNITVPFLTVLATRDHIVPQPAAAPLLDLVGSAEKDELRLDAGHMGLVVGRTAARTTIPRILRFLREQSEALS